MTSPACPRCGAPMLPLAYLGELALEADDALDRMRLVVPTTAKVNLHLLAVALPCHGGTCHERTRG